MANNNFTWDDLRREMRDDSKLNKMFNRLETSKTIEQVVDVIVSNWESLYDSTPLDYIDNYIIWREEMKDLYDSNINDFNF